MSAGVATAAEVKKGELERLVEELGAITSDTRRAFGSLSAARLDWKPAPERWSVGQCFEHLIKTNEKFLPALERVNSGEHRATLWQRVSPLSGFFGRLVLRGLASGRKVKASAAISPTASGVGGDIVERFAAHQGEVASLLGAARAEDLKRTVVTSPVAAFVTYTLFDACRIMVAHERRHFEQARRVTETEGFPLS
jgi:DinB superfamily